MMLQYTTTDNIKSTNIMCYNSRFCGETLVPGTCVGTLTNFVAHQEHRPHLWHLPAQQHTLQLKYK